MALPVAAIGALVLNNLDKAEYLYSKLAPILSKSGNTELRQQLEELQTQLEQAKRDTQSLVEGNDAARQTLKSQQRITLASLIVAALSLAVAGGAIYFRP